jgi:uncharacterized membrane protein
MNGSDVHGPIDVIVVEFPSGGDMEPVRSALVDLLDAGTIRLYDLMVVRREQDGTITEVDLTALPDGGFALEAFAGARSGLLGDDDLEDAAAVLEPGTTAALLVYENAWAVPFVAAARGAGGELVASARLSAQEIMDALDVLDNES